MLQAFNITTHEPVNAGDPVTTFRGETGTLVRCDQASLDGKAGKVAVRLDGADRDDHWYGTVVELYVVDTESKEFCEAAGEHNWYYAVTYRDCPNCGTREPRTAD